ncbi:uncharacterized protein LOC127719043 [Mytilus californianus]|uniref:uncharacterized protein LOC127719043 n=1 Tax=Mytilus californianus TaxID=6549 RepID=UPI002245BE83|nr:uncharacterized protein LOC127719043 [Mytilus californianus]
MESSSLRLCDNCEHRHISTAAVAWCPDCDEALCSECKDHHDASKIAKFHKTISLTEFDKLPSFIKDTSVYCTDHDQRCELYCCSHRQCCCIVCLKESHCQCEKLDTIQDVIKNVKTSPVLEDFENDLKCIMTNFDSLIQNRLENKTRINAQKLAFIEEIQSVRKLLNDKLDEMVKRLKDTMAANVEEVGLDLDNLVHDLDVHKSHISTLQEELKTAINIATDLQVFLGLKPLELKVEEELSYLETLQTNKAMDEVDLVLDIAPTTRAISEGSESFGEISQSRKRNDLELGVRKKEQAQILLPSVNELSNIQFSEIASFQLSQGENGMLILGCTILPEGLLVFSDSCNNRLIICDSDSTFQREIPLSFSPRTVVYINNSNVGVTCQSSSKVVLVELITGKIVSTFSTFDPCYGISFRNDTLTIRISGYFLLTTLSGEVKARLKAIGSTHCCTGEDSIFSSSSSSHRVLCFNNDGDLTWQFQDSKLQSPKDVAVDENGFVLAVGEISNNCFAISPDGQTGREILSNLDYPYSLAFDKTSKLMVITNKKGSVRVYNKN